jgi:signal transduction histidine kinase/CheY-like chemotaxis protein
MRSLAFLLFFLYLAPIKAQYVFQEGKLPNKTSLISYSTLADVGHRNLKPSQISREFVDLKPWPLKGEYGNLGFTDHNYWIRFQIKNPLHKSLHYFLEVAEPMTDNLNLYLWKDHGKMEIQRNGDNLPFNQRSVPYRKPVFDLNFEPGETKTAFLEIRNDGEKNNLPLNLISDAQFLKTTLNDQIILGVFYGIILIIVLTYSFFYFALKEKSFLYYSLYVLMAGLCHFALDGLFHQYFTPDNSWLNLHAVLLFAIPASYFFGKYSEIILDIKNRLKKIHFLFKALYRILVLVFLGLIFFPSFLKYAYPVVNILTLLGIVLISLSIVQILMKKGSLDVFYTLGIIIMFSSFILVILLNFGIISRGLSIDNITKIGIGLEIMALSISMANRIRILKTNKEEMQALALAKSEEMNEIKSHFLSNMSHELRTPLNAILGITQILEKDNLDPNWKNNLAMIKSAAFHLVSSVNDILDFSMMENGELKLQEVEFNPGEILNKINIIYSKEAEAKNLEYIFQNHLKPESWVLGDPNRLEQVVQNIIHNAIKFTSSGAVVLKVEPLPVLSDQLSILITISDTGIGISEKKLANIFEMFSQVDIRNKRKFGGFGIGLCVAKALVELQNGDLKIESTLNLGTVCTIRLSYPRIEKKALPLVPAAPESRDLKGRHILVVEDNPMNQMVVKLILKKWKNTEMSFASDGKEGLQILNERKIDLVLMDLQMPVMDGYEAIERIRSGEAGNENTAIPIIVVTADITEETKLRVDSMGVDGYLTKPIDHDLLFDKVYELLFRIQPQSVEV